MSDVDNEQPTSDTPPGDPDEEVVPADRVKVEESGSAKNDGTPVEEPLPVSEGADGEAEATDPAAQGAHEGESDESDVTAASGAVADEVKETTKKPAPKESAAAAGDGVKQVSRGGGTPRGQAFRRYWPFAALGLTTLVLVVGLFLAISADKDSPTPEARPPAAQGPMETFSAPDGSFTLRYPKAWRRITVPPEVPDLRLVLSTGALDPAAPANPNPTGNDGMWVRVIPPDQVEQKYTEFGAEIMSLTGDKPCGAEGSACLGQEQVNVAGMNGIRFIYTSRDAISGQNSIHIQYFLRRNQQGNLYVIVFQAIPTTDLSGLAPAFDEVVASFQAA